MELNLAAYGPIFLGVMILITLLFKWPVWFHYIWAAVAIVWGVMALL